MGSSMVRYKVRPERADENVALVEAVYAQLAAERPEGLHYATFRLPDGVSFMHIVIDTVRTGAATSVRSPRSRRSAPTSRAVAPSRRSPRRSP